ncbi:MAG: SDR family NAD(P)-dependent oxidoreductase [Bacilli bacterium]|nr:SDR family NAD(P)-dependent oxidoreductase [Bacilli bacterium]
MKSAKYLAKHTSSQEGKRFLITGASNGIGLEAAKALLYLGASVTFMVRNEAKAKACIEAISKELGRPVDADIAIYDQASPTSIRACIASLPSKHYDAIVLNAGVYFPKTGSLGEKNNSLTLQVNATGTQACFDAFYERYPDAKYVFTTSVARCKAKNHDYAQYFHCGDKRRWKDYGISKQIAVDMMALALEKGAKAYLTHPGMCKTGIINGFAPLMKRIGNGFMYLVSHHAWKASLGITLLCANDYEPGTYLAPRGPLEVSGYPKVKRIHGFAELDKETWKSFYEGEQGSK